MKEIVSSEERNKQNKKGDCFFYNDFVLFASHINENQQSTLANITNPAECVLFVYGDLRCIREQNLEGILHCLPLPHIPTPISLHTQNAISSHLRINGHRRTKAISKYYLSCQHCFVCSRGREAQIRANFRRAPTLFWSLQNFASEPPLSFDFAFCPYCPLTSTRTKRSVQPIS